MLRSTCFLFLLLITSLTFSAQAKRHNDNLNNFQRQQAAKAAKKAAAVSLFPTTTTVSDDSDLVRAVRDRRNVNFVQASNVEVVQILPDDNDGLRHQRWYVRLSDGSKVFAVYNIDITKRVPIQVGQKISLGGEFKWTNQGALIHWLHADPEKRRPDGYVDVNGVRYGIAH